MLKMVSCPEPIVTCVGDCGEIAGMERFPVNYG